MGVNGIYGLSGSGIDVESMVKAGMLSRQNEYDKMYKQETRNTWIKSAYADIYSSLTTFKYTTLDKYQMSSNMNAMSATSSNASAVTAKANASAVAMSHTVSVESMSSNAYLISARSISRNNAENAAGSIYLRDNAFARFTKVTTDGDVSDQDAEYSYQKRIASHGADEVTISYNGTDYSGTQLKKSETDGTYTLNGATVNLNDLTFKVTEGGEEKTYTGTSNMAVGVDDTDGNLSFTSLEDAVTVKGSDAAIKFKIFDNNDPLDTQLADDVKKQTISYSFADLYTGKTYNDLYSDINALNTNVKATYDAANDSFSIYNSEGGKANSIQIIADTEGAAELFNNLHLQQSKDGELSGHDEAFAVDASTSVHGSDGTVKVDGRTYTGITDNRLTVAGVTYTFLGPTTEKTTVSVANDTDSVIESVKSFVEDYNKILDSLNEKIYETSYSDYQPLTKSQEEKMTETQIDKWNEKAKSGLLANSSVLKKIVSEMRKAVSTPNQSVDSEYNSASAIGITSSNDKGHLTLDEDKLKKALAADPDCVYQLFASNQDTYYYADTNKKQSYMAEDDYNNTGIANRLYFTTMTDGLKSISSYAGTSADTNDQSSLGTLITNLKAKMATFKTQMDAFEDTLYKRYDSMEVAIQRMMAQFNMISGGN